MLQRPHQIDSFVSTLTGILFPQTRIAALSELMRLGFVDTDTADAWVRELSNPQYVLPHVEALITQERVRFAKALDTGEGELTRHKTLGIINNFLGSVRISPHSEKFDRDSVKHMRALDFGAGVWSSPSVSLVLYANGFERVDAFEPYPIHADMATESVFLTLRWIMEHPSEFSLFGMSAEDMCRRIAALDLADAGQKLADFASGQSNSVDFGPVTVRNSLDGIESGIYDVIFSNSVLEHVMDMPGSLTRQHEILKDDGLCVHTVDFSDHRANLPDTVERDRFMLYYDGVLDEINGWRSTDLEAMFAMAGFDGVKINRLSVPDGYVRVGDLIDHFKRYSPAVLAEMVNTYLLTKRR